MILPAADGGRASPEEQEKPSGDKVLTFPAFAHTVLHGGTFAVLGAV